MGHRLTFCGEVVLGVALTSIGLCASAALRSGEAHGMRVASILTVQRPVADFSIASQHWRSGREAGWSVCWKEAAETDATCVSAEVRRPGVRRRVPQ